MSYKPGRFCRIVGSIKADGLSSCTVVTGPLERCLFLRYGYVFLAYAKGADGGSLLPITAVCVSLEPPAGRSAVFVRADWERQVDDRFRDYICGSFEDWVESIESSPGMLPPLLLDLSVGPLRTIQHGECEEQELAERIEAFLQAAYLRFGTS